MAGIGKVKALQIWCKNRLIGYRDVEITNMTTSWRSGMAFCALIHKFRPDLIDYDSLSKENVFDNNELAFSVAETLGVPALLDAEDMVRLEVPDKLSIITYVAQLHNCFKDEVPAGGPDIKTASKRHSTPVQRSVTMRSPESKRRPMATSKKAEAHTTSGSDICIVCDGKVYLIEKHIVDGKLYHRSCFRSNNRKSDTSALTGSPKLSLKSSPSRHSALPSNGLKKTASSLPSTPSTPTDNRPDWQKKLQERSLAKKVASTAVPRSNSQSLLETLPEDQPAADTKAKPSNEIEKVKLRSKAPSSTPKRAAVPRAVSVGVDLDERILKLRQLRESAKASSASPGNAAVKARLERLQKITSKDSAADATTQKSTDVTDTEPVAAAEKVSGRDRVEVNMRSAKVETVEQPEHTSMETDSQSSSQNSPVHSSEDLSAPEASKPKEPTSALDLKSNSDNILGAKLTELPTETTNPFEMESEESRPAPIPSEADKTSGDVQKEQHIVVEKSRVKAEEQKLPETDINSASSTTSKSSVAISTGSTPSAPARNKRSVKTRATTSSPSRDTTSPEKQSAGIADTQSSSPARLPLSSLNITTSSSSAASKDFAQAVEHKIAPSTVSSNQNQELASVSKSAESASTAAAPAETVDAKVSQVSVPVPANETEHNCMDCDTESSSDESPVVVETPSETPTSHIAEDDIHVVKQAIVTRIEPSIDVSKSWPFTEVVTEQVEDSVVERVNDLVEQPDVDTHVSDKSEKIPSDYDPSNRVVKDAKLDDVASERVIEELRPIAADKVGSSTEKTSHVEDRSAAVEVTVAAACEVEDGTGSEDESKPKPVRPPRSPAVSKRQTDTHSQITTKVTDTPQQVINSDSDTRSTAHTGRSQQVTNDTESASSVKDTHPHRDNVGKKAAKKLESSTSPVVMRKGRAKESPPRPKTVAAGTTAKSHFYLDQEHKNVVEPPPKPARQPVLAAAKDNWEDSLANWSGKRKDKSKSTWYTTEAYPTECNPFGDDEEESQPQATEHNQNTSQTAATIVDNDYDSSLNPFADDESSLNPFADADNEPAVEAADTKAVEQLSEHTKVKLLPSNPFEISDDDEPKEEVVSKKKIVPDVGLEVEEPKRPPTNRHYGIILPDTSGKKATPKKKLAPPPPQTPPSAPPTTQPPALLSDNKENTAVKKPADSFRQTTNETTPSEKYIERDHSRLTDISEDESSSIEAQKRRHRPAPPRPMPPKRRPHSDYGVEPDDISKELAAIESKQRQLEEKGRELEQAIRTADEAMASQQGSSSTDDDELLSRWLDTINEKNHLVRRESELVFIAKHQELETKQADIEWELREIMHQAENLKTDDDKLREEDLLNKLVTVVTERSKLVDKMDDERLRQQDEDRKIHMTLGGSKLGEAVDKSTSSPNKKADKKAKKKKDRNPK